MISAKIIADSKGPNDTRCTTFIIVFPRIVLAEFNTHRMISKNSASSRAIPFVKMVKMVQDDPFVPLRFMKDHKGMQGNEYFEGNDAEEIKAAWYEARDWAVNHALHLNSLGLTKQLVNRTLEPYMWHTAICTGTDWENFFALRAHPAAEIHIADLAEKMLAAYNESEPKVLQPGEWHIPFGDTFDVSRIEALCPKTPSGAISQQDFQLLKVKIATARCARVSYLNFEGKDDYEADIKLHDMLSTQGHMSPFEHCAVAGYVGYHGNFNGFKQYRSSFKEQNRTDSRVIKK